MAELITMPKLGFDMAEGTLVRWLKAEGDPLKKGEVIAEIETDKATVEVESGYAGVMLRHLADEGADLPVNAPIAIVADEGEALSDDEIDALLAGADVKAPGKPVSKDEKAVQAAKKVEETPGDDHGEEKGETLAGGKRSSPLARRIAAEHEIALTELEGSGPRGRIVKQDIEDYLAKLRAEGKEQEAETVGKALQPLASFTAGAIPDDEVIAISRLRQAISRRMQDSFMNIPHFYLTREYKTGTLMRLRQELNQFLPGEEKLSVNDFIVKAVALALRQFPNLNASIEDDAHIRRHGHVNVGVAVAVEGGLMTVVCKDADQKPLRLIAREVREMASRARERKVKPEDIEGSTFSISNLGMFSIDEFSAIINPPEAAILAVGAVQDVPAVEDGELVIASRMKATISADHRVTDGAEAAEFMAVLAEYLEAPLKLLV
ncbi:MAG TPA: dihydrolipoamide acetyltransferase family protein [Brevefilum fermentans]|jgi:pyruvate dehydrogenase E2 component (dihydrolipoamide acetyltransferase)|uniref:Dihydrolipoamide acetyltransferase component of pyruvate dehydrogenase complex n=1 Tax=Candidatus Brevifilum fermentans TaxID=1986204 RepID=A0A1Y6K864_9CHLR|nr:dihydrolipoamide acetyltransferase family protein [Brevefilum fermentans]MDI9565647.1 dihydrolipoamide acetyltransferase family protein [Chloroflexota bacterium]OQB83424.1 MAG: Dihydrolipoyllysine-residue acetyltransferase component of pyruvate dehydrogenase complex [Chloroflexi bacterium ADurb.Bin120]SMX54789.1 Dihydrolipoyllysine-residue acetyltransferase component of pyruvate dehydrogenase complex [Brevefilum fermentans]HOM66469.1 dihydrolipoamide acetyltransferase family protein [Brevefi